LPTPPASSKAVTIWPVRPTLPEPMPQQTLIPETQQPAGPPATPHANTPPVRGTESTLCAKRNDAECVAVIHKRMEPGSQQPELVPQQTLSIPETQQPAATPKNVEDWIEPARPQGAIIRDTQQSPDVRQKVVLYEEDPADPNGKRYVGSAIWRTEMVTPSAGQPQELAIRADIEVPERKIMVRWALRRNTDKGLPATHTVEIMFKVPADFPAGGITNVPGILMKQAEQTRGIPLAGLTVKVTPGFYLIGLSNLDPDKERNFQLLDERGWFDIPVVYNNNRRAILSMEKGTTGESVFAEAFKAWKQ
jgi:hypothetical protein